MPNIESRCADIHSKIRTLSSEEVNVEDISAFTDAVSALLDEVILEVKHPDTRGKMSRSARRKVRPSVKVWPSVNEPVKSNNTGAIEPESGWTFKTALKLAAFLLAIKGILSTISDIAHNTSDLQGFPAPADILNQLTKAYEDNIVPMLDTLEKSADKLDSATPVISLGVAVLGTCKEINKYRDKMDTNEKIYAVCGTVLMFAGLGMLIAATINPTTMPVIAAIAVVTLGVYMCQRSLERHKNLEARNINNSLNNLHSDIKNVSNSFKVSDAVIDAVKFSAATASRVKENVPPAPTWSTRASMAATKFSNSLRNFVDRIF